MHDLLAELAGYRNEVGHSRTYGKDQRADAAQAEVERIEGEVREQAARLRTAEDAARAAGQDGVGDRLGADAARLEAALTPPGNQTAVTDGQAAGVEQAVTRRAAKTA